jgi:hypothetical protein
VKITFEGEFISDVIDEMQRVLDFMRTPLEEPKRPPAAPVKAAGKYQFPGPVEVAPEDIPVDIPVDIPAETPVETPVDTPAKKPKSAKTEKQIAAAAKMRAAKDAKKAAREAAAHAPIVQGMPMPPPPKSAEGMDPAEVVKIRLRTIEELQEAYANGFQKEVFELLARFGNGAKSFRELPPEAFVPIREAIDNGALT